jgi:hypothetical protein
MRQGQQQQNRRGRGRSGGRKGANPLSRSFESSGPDVKIRGTAQHIAEKYMTLARDAIGSGDLVLGENYLQHAEHYNRIIMAAQLDSGVANGNGQKVARHDGDLLPGESYDDDDGDEGDGDQPGEGGSMEQQPASFEAPQQQDQPRFQRDQGHRDQGPPRHRDRDHNQQRPQRDNRPYEPRNFDNRPPREPRQFEPRGDRPYQQRDRGYNRDRDNRNNDNRGNDVRANEPRSFEPFNPEARAPETRSFEPVRPINGHGEQPRTFEAPQPPMPVDVAAEPRIEEAGAPGEQRAPRARRRRPRHEGNGAQGEFGAAGAPFAGDQPAPAEAAPPPPSEDPGT